MSTVYVSAIIFCGRATALACDGRCDKAWGITARPSVPLSTDPDDFAWLADDELGTAPADPGVSEGGDSKPWRFADTPEDIGRRHNRWCARECERSVLHERGLLALPDFTGRRRNKPRA